jgi:hypothetical protein
VKPTDDQQVNADVLRLLNHVDHCISQFDQAAFAFSKVRMLDQSAWIMLRELGRAGSRVYNATSAIEKRLEREAVARKCQRLGLE